MRAAASMPVASDEAPRSPGVGHHPDIARKLSRVVHGWLVTHAETWPVIPVILISALAHAVNLFGYPYYHTDEGTYVAQAWAILQRGELAHYTYWYDHAPLGWIQVAAWAVLSQGFYTFGTPVDSGRVLMLLFHCWSVYLVYQIARTVTRSALTATLAGLLFGLSAYGVFYHRRVLLDNLTTPWMLLSILMIVRSPLALTRAWLSAVALAVSILSKELTIFLVPVLGAVVFMRAERPQRLFATASWAFIVMAIISTYPLMALLKNEMFPAGTALGGEAEHVSLIESLHFQASRGKDGGLLSPDSSFWRETAAWAANEPLLALGGSLGAVAGLLLIRRFPLYGAISLATLALYGFLARGGIILGFYYVPLLPLLALNVALPLGWLVQTVPVVLAQRLVHSRWRGGARWSARAVSWLLALLCLTPLARGYHSGALGLEQNPLGLWTIEQTHAQRDAIDWIRRNMHPDSAILVDDEAWVALRDPEPGEPAFPNTHWYFKIDGDPEIREGVFKNDARNVDYILNTQDVYDRSREPDVPLARTAIDSSAPIATFNSGRYPVEVRRVHRLNRWRAAQDPMLGRSWEGFKAAFIQDGRVIDPGDGAATTSERQAATLLRAVYMGDRAAFDEVWGWTRSHLQVRGDGLLARRYRPHASGAADAVLDTATSTAADQDAALALLFAARQWHHEAYRQHALEILAGIWRHETTLIGGTRVIVAGDWAKSTADAALLNPSHFAPYAYRIFAAADARTDWLALVDSSYQILERIQTSPDLGADAGVVPNLVAFDGRTGAVHSAGQFSEWADQLSVDTSRLPWQLALDLIWYGDARSRAALDRLSLPRREIVTTGRLVAGYDLEGRPTVDYATTSSYASVLPTLLFQGNDDLAHLIFADKIVRAAFGAEADDPEAGGAVSATPGAAPGASRSQPGSLDDQTWVWFATALMHGGLANLWAGEATVNWPLALARIQALPTSARSPLTPDATRAARAAGSGRSVIEAAAAARGRSGSEASVGARPPSTAFQPAASGVSSPGEQATILGRAVLPIEPETAQPPAAPAVVGEPSAATVAAAQPPTTHLTAPQAFPARPSVVVPHVPSVGRSGALSAVGAVPRRRARAPVVPIFRPSPPQPSLDVYVVQPGDSLLEIAARHGTDVETLAALNALADTDAIMAGAALRVPALAAHHPTAREPRP